MELYSFLFDSQVASTPNTTVGFPSPYGVIFILIIPKIGLSLEELIIFKVSVSLWSYIHSYLVAAIFITLSLNLVSVSLWSYIHSYKYFEEVKT